MKGRTAYIAVASALAILAAGLYLAELLNREPLFDAASFSLNYVVSLPFMLLSIILNCCVVALMNGRAMRRSGVAARLGTEGLAAVLSAVLLVIVGNLPFIGDMAEYVRSAAFLKSVAAATLINVFIMATAEFLMQTFINRRLQKENAVLQYRQLKSQINPHFLFNSLNALVSLINKDPELAVKYTRQLSAVYRYVLTQDQKDTVTLREETEFIGNYIEILGTRFGDGLHFRFDIRPSDFGRAVPPMSLQLLVENAVKHNAVDPAAPLEISISTDGNWLCVSNNLRPRLSSGEGTGVGLSNLSRKYEILAGRGIRLSREGGTFNVKLPLL